MYQCDTNSLSTFLDNQSCNERSVLHIIMYIELIVMFSFYIAVTQLYNISIVP